MAEDTLSAVEIVLRDFIEQTLSKELGAEWLARSGLKPDRIQQLERRRRQDEERREGAKVDDRLLYYSDLGDLHEIIIKNWQYFEPCLADREEMDVYLTRLSELRNPEKHARGLLPFERALIEGMAGEIRNKVTMYRSQRAGPEKEFFPRIEYVKDSFGNEVRPAGQFRQVQNTGLTLHPGEEVTFECHGWDPEGEELSWFYCIYTGASATWPRHAMEGNTFVWKLTEEDVGVPRIVDIYLVSKRPYHRNAGSDDDLGFSYKVLPRS